MDSKIVGNAALSVPKKLLSIILSLCMLLSITAGLNHTAYAEDTYGYFTYRIENDEAIITGCDKEISGDVVIPSTLGGYPVTSIGNYAFYNCTSLTSVTIPDSVISINYSSFSGCTSLTSVTMPDSEISIGYSSFSGCTNLTSITISSGVTCIDEYAFYNCKSLTSINVDSENQYYSSIDGVLFNKDKTELIQYPIGNTRTSYTVPDSVTSIDKGAFSYCTSLTSVAIGKGVTNIGISQFYYCTNLSSITVVSENENYSTQDGVLFNKNKTKLIMYPVGNTKAIYIIPKSVISIDYSAFYDCSGLKSITIPDSVISIGNSAFYGCSGLKSIIIPDSVTSIGDGAFEGCTSLTSITIPDSVKSISECTFYNCTSLTSITIPDSVKSISECTFYNCTGLTSVTIPNSVTSIDERAFYNCTSLTSVTIPDSVTSIDEKTFYNCTGLTSVTIPDSVKNIGKYAFFYCSSLTSITIPDSVTRIGYGAFGCTSLTSVKIPDGVTGIGYATFRNCTSLTSITIPDSLTSIGGSAFVGCKKLKYVCYKGTKAQWKKIKIKNSNDIFKIIEIHCTDSVINGKHKYKNVIKNATKKKNGTITPTCTVCGAKKETITVKNVKKIELTKAKKAIKVKWSKVKNISGYEIQYSTSKSFKSAKTVTVKKAKTTSKTIKKLKAKKKYYVRIRTYKTVNGEKVYSTWSKAKAVKIKK